MHPDSVPLRPSSDHRAPKNILLFREETKAARNYMFSGWNPTGIHQMALCWNGGRDLRLSQPVWVRTSAVLPRPDLTATSPFPKVTFSL